MTTLTPDNWYMNFMKHFQNDVMIFLLYYYVCVSLSCIDLEQRPRSVTVVMVIDEIQFVIEFVLIFILIYPQTCIRSKFCRAVTCHI